jgi:hypothetical protein
MTVFYSGNEHITKPSKELPNAGRISYVTSSDEGRTWSDAQVLHDGPHDDRDPSITLLPDGRLACTFFSYPDRGAYIIFSDDGIQWSEPIRISILYNVSSPVRVLSTGRLIVGLYDENAANGTASGAATFSDDGGKTWPSLVVMDNAGQYLDAETDIIELRDGILYAIHRGGGNETTPMYFTTSMDKGTNWGRSKPLDFVGHCPYLLRASDQIVLLGYRGLLDGQWQTLLRYSVDECRTWSDPILIDSARGAYPSMTRLSDDSVLIVYYEEGESSDIHARRFKISRLGIE